MKKNAVSGISVVLLYAACLWAVLPIPVLGQKITGYESCTMLCTPAITAGRLIGIRSFFMDGEPCFLLVNPLKLTTSIRKKSEVRACSTSWTELYQQYVPDPYIKGLWDAKTASASLQDGGITHFSELSGGIDLTADLCPSKRELDRDFFNELVKILGKEEQPVPIAIAVTGVWMDEHPDDLAWLKELVKKREITVTWINHSYHHRVGKDSDLSRSFLLQQGIDIDQEILRTEKKLIGNGLLPSVFFRFPGLVSSDSLVKKVISFGLIPIGSDAWLAKNQWPKDGSIVLVHANGNEPVGIQRFYQLLREQKPNIENKQWLLFDLQKSVIETGKESYEETYRPVPVTHSDDTIEDLDLLE
jgi:hypothetical protein